MIRAVIWDMGGVIVRTVDPVPREQLAQKFGYSSQGLEELLYGGTSGERCQRGEIPYEDHMMIVREKLGLSPEEMKTFTDQFWAGDRLENDLVNYIRTLKKKYKIGLLSNAFPTLRKWLDNSDIFKDVFDKVVISSEQGIVKPDSRIYHLALQELEIQPDEAVFIDDTPRNVTGAIQIGMHAIQFHDPAQIKAELDEFLAHNIANS